MSARAALPLGLMAMPAVALLALLFVGPIAVFLGLTLLTDGSGRAAGVLAASETWAALGDTTLIAASTTATTLALGYPLAYALTRTRGLVFGALIAAVVLPHFTSVIVRTYAWMVLLGRSGVVNDALRGAHLIAEPLPLLYGRTGVLIGMTYVLLPYMVLTLYAALRGIDARLLSAARGMGASGRQAFLRVLLPLSAPGAAAGCLTVFILALGFFVTPALMGGRKDMTVAMLIGRQIELTPDWGAAAALALTLLGPTLLLFAANQRFAPGAEAMR